MKLVKSIAVIAIMGACFSALANLTTPCEVLDTKNQVELAMGQKYQSVEIEQFFKKLSEECRLEKEFNTYKDLAAQFSVPSEQVSVYRALRFIKREDFAYASKDRIPVSKIYQLRRIDYRPNGKRKNFVWRNWVQGISQLDVYQQQVLSGEPITKEDLAEVHRGFYRVTLEVGDFSKHPRPGQFKNPENYEKGFPWWKVKPKYREMTEKQINKVNSEMNAMGMLPETLARDSNGKSLGQIVFFHKNKVWSADTRFLQRHLDLWLEFVNDYFNVMASGYQRVPAKKFPLMTPMEFAAHAQKWIVTLHGFHEGNGRISRFWQDLVLAVSGLPFASSGDLMNNDVLDSRQDYYNLFYKSTKENVAKLLHCVQEVYPKFLETNDEIPTGLKKNMPYDCAVLRN